MAATAKARGTTVRALLDDLSQQAADATLMGQAADQMVQLRASDPSAWDDYRNEGREWEQGTVERIAT